MLRSETVTTIYYFVVCDECGVRGPEGIMEHTPGPKAKKQGWLLLDDGSHFCPEHKECEYALQKKREIAERKRHEGIMGLAQAMKVFSERRKAEGKDPPEQKE